ncbi:apolipophorins [Athalia rosae]|uniref:apolipophorins n=1 Tax=Athalia rosae TaxID=37344 RepID=UPI0020339911|nr:apolipophorins [Athalia rosae]
MAHHPPRVILAGLLLGFLLIVSPSKANKCRSGCHGIHSDKAYQEGRTYTYQLDGESVTSVSDAQGHANLKLNAIVELAVKPDCVRQIRLKNVRINGAPASHGDIEAHALQFNYHNGHIDSEVCAEPEDSQAALNVKRAVISLFQDAVVENDGTTTHHETDVFGRCTTDFTFSTNGESRTIKKLRNLEQCSFRESIKQDFITATFNQNSQIKSAPLLAAEQKVEQQFARGILQKAVSVETYNYRPFSNGESGTKTIVEIVLTFKEERGDSPTAPVSEPKSIVFESPHIVVKSSVDAIQKALHATKDSMPDAVNPDAARKFAELIKVLRQSSKNDILTVYSRVRAGAGFEKDSAKKVFLDALFRTGTGDAAEAAVELVKKRELNQLETVIYYTSLVFVRHASLSSVTAVTSLLDESEIPRIAYLGIGSLIGKYCEEHSCENVGTINAALGKISSKLHGKPTTRKQEDVVISALKGLGNARYLDDETLIKIAKIATDKKQHSRVRVAAIQALPTRCSMKWKEPLLHTLADRVEDSEIRIKTYLALVACPCPHVAGQLKTVLDKETVNQVGSFITSHLRNLRASTNPDKQEAKSYFGHIKPRTRFPEDFRKFSFNNELSYSIDAFGVGSSAESNVIYSQNSFVPSSANLNLTTEIFGRTFNFLEIDTRFENFDRLLEKYFGPKGTLRSSKLKETVLEERETVTNLWEKIVNRFNKKVGRHARNVNPKAIDNFSKKIHLPDTELDDDLELDLSIKLFGAELVFLSYQGSRDKLNTDKVIEQLLDLLESGVDKAKNFNFHFKNHLHFLDAELVYPTGLGFPLTLGITGTSAVHFKTSGKVDLVAIFNDPKSSAIQIALEPSASISIVGSMVVEGYGIESGLKVVSTLHTSTGTDVSVKLLDGNGVDINVGIPRPKQEIISVTSEVLLSSGAKGDNYVAPKFGRGVDHADCFDQLSSAIGLTVCGKISYPYDSIAAVQKKSLFPLSGPAAFAVYLENNDVKSYHFKAYYNSANPKARSVEILLETPNSRTNRRISLVLEAALEPEKVLRATFDSPFKKASAEAIMKNNDRELTLAVSVHHDSIEYFIRTGIVIAGGNKYRPILEYKVPDHVEKLAGIKNGVKNNHKNGQQYTVGGVIEISKQSDGKKYIFDKVTLASGGQTLIGLDGNIHVLSKGADADMKVEYGGDNLILKGHTVLTNIYNYKADISAVSSTNRPLGFSVSVERKGDQNSFEETAVIVHGADLNSQTNRISYSGKNNFKYVSAKEFDISVDRKVTYPAIGLVLHVEGAVSPKSLSYDFDFHYNKFKLESEFSGKIGDNPGNFEIDFETKLQENSIEFKTKRTVLAEHKSKIESSLELHPGGKYELDATIDYDVKPNDINAQVKAELKVNDQKVAVDVGLLSNHDRLNSRALITVGNNKYIDFLLTAQYGAAPNGHFKLNLKDYLTSSGQFKFQRGQSGDGQFEINIPKFQRKITGHGELSVVGSKHVVNVEILYDAGKDPKKRLKFSSDSDFTSTSVDSKNVLEVVDYKTVVNVKGNHEKTSNIPNFDGSVDVTLPNGRYLVWKGSRTSSIKNDKREGKMDFELADYINKGGKCRKIVYHGEVHDLDLKEITFRANHNLQFVNLNGEDVKLSLNGKYLPNGDDKRISDGKFEVSGSKIPSPFTIEVSYDGQKDNLFGTFKVYSSLGNKLSFQVHGNTVRGNNDDKPCTADVVFELKLPSDKLKNVKLDISASVLTPEKTGGRFEYIQKTQLTYNEDKTAKIDWHFANSGIPDEQNVMEGSGKVTFAIHSNAPVTAGYTYRHNPINELKESAGSFNINYGNKQTSLAVDSSYRKNLDVLNINIKASTPIEKIRNVEVKLQHTVDNRGANFISEKSKTDLTVIVDQVKYIFSEDYTTTSNSFDGHWTYTAPRGKQESTLKLSNLGSKEYKGEFKSNGIHGHYDADAHIKAQSVDDFFGVVNFDSDKLETRKIHVEVNNKPAKGGKRIVLIVTADGKNIVTGSTNYKEHSEGGKRIIEGNGSLKIRESTQSSSFKYTRQLFTGDVDGENGVANLLTINFGQSSIVGEYKATEKELMFLNSYCEQSADCATVKLHYKTTPGGALKRSDEYTAEVDLRKFNVPFEFGLKSTQTLDPKSGFDNQASLYLHSSDKKTEYSYHVYVHPTESGVVYTLPSRELALIAILDLPKNKRSGTYKVDISAYLDRKNNPKDKTSLISTVDVVVDKGAASVSGETKFTYPSQPKELSVKGKVHIGGAHLLDANVDIDVFAKKNQKIVVTAKLFKEFVKSSYNVTGIVSIVSRGQQLKIDLTENLHITDGDIFFESLLSYTDEHQKPKSTGITFAFDVKELHLLVKSPDKDLIRVDSKIQLSKNLQKVSTDLSIFGKDPVVITFEVKDLNTFSYSSYAKNKPNDKLEASGRLVIGDLAEARADLYKDGAKKQLFHVLLHLDERRYLKPDLTFNKDNIAQTIDIYRTRVIDVITAGGEFVDALVKEIITEIKDLLEHLKKASPNFKPLVDHYQAELEKIKQESNIESESFKQVQAKFNEIFGGTIRAVVEALKKLSESIDELQKIFEDLAERVNTALKTTIPEIQKTWRAIHALATETIHEVATLAATYIKTIIDIINTHQDEFKQIAVIAAELGQDVATIVFKAIGRIQNEVKDFFTVLIEELKALPTYEFIQQKYQELLNYKIHEGVIRAVSDIVQYVNKLLPTTELQHLLTAVWEYVVLHVKQEKVDEVQEIKKLYELVVDALQSVFELVKSQGIVNKFVDIFETQIPWDITAISRLPGISSLKVSVISLIRNREWPTPAEIFQAYRPPADPSNLIPPFSKYALFIDGGHFFTFDGRHLTLPGQCSYVLARDARDGNFSVVGEFDNGKLNSVTVTEPTESITIQSAGTILVNNHPAEFPASTKNLQAHLKEPLTLIKSDYGVEVHCVRNGPLSCSVRVSGFYHGKVRGILGNGNNEPWDDFTLPSGKVTENEGEFGNSFKITSGCPNVQTVDHHAHHHDATCTEFFSGRSPLSPCFNFVNPGPYRQACDHASMAGDKKEGSCNMAMAYFSVCREAGIATKVPASCVHCENGNQKIDVDTSFSVQHPKQQADIVFVVEQATENAKVFHDLVTPLMTVLKTELKDYGITDVHIGLIGFGDHLEVPVHYTVKGNRNIDGEVKNMNFAEKKPFLTLEQAKAGGAKERMEFLAQKVNVELGTLSITAAYSEALSYDFRPSASKTIIGVIATPCEKSLLPVSLQQLRLLLGQLAYNNLGATYHQIANLDEILLSGKPVKNVVGYDGDSIYTFADSKKNPMEGNSQLRKTMSLTNEDVCANFAVNSGGAVFGAHNFLDAKPNQKKQFIQVAGRRIASSLASTVIREECVCRQQNDGLYPKSECEIVSRKEKEPTARHTKTGTKG